MSYYVKVPSVGESISSGVISTWYQRDGATVGVGDLLFTLDTDKVSNEITATEAGILKRLVDEGAEVKIGQIVAEIFEAPITDTKKSEEKEEASESKRVGALAPPSPTSSIVEISPVVEKSAETLSPSMPSSETRFTRRRLTPLRRKIAAQLVSSQQTAAILTTFHEVDMAPIMRLRGEVQGTFQKKYGVKLGLMSFFIKAVVEGLKVIPSINARLEEEELIENHYYDIGIAVGTEKGLIVPVLRDCDQQSLAALEAQLVAYATKAREGKIALADLQGGVFTISNGGVYGSLLSTPILNPPQSGILGMHTIQERPVVVEGQIVIRPMMYLALSYDHRIVDGKEAVTFLIKVKEALENPLRLFL